jgi:hypothetical protein
MILIDTDVICEPWKPAPNARVTIEPSGDMDPDIVAMRRAVRAMVGAVVNERPTVANWLRV